MELFLDLGRILKKSRRDSKKFNMADFISSRAGISVWDHFDLNDVLRGG